MSVIKSQSILTQTLFRGEFSRDLQFDRFAAGVVLGRPSQQVLVHARACGWLLNQRG